MEENGKGLCISYAMSNWHLTINLAYRLVILSVMGDKNTGWFKGNCQLIQLILINMSLLANVECLSLMYTDRNPKPIQCMYITVFQWHSIWNLPVIFID